MNKRVYLVTLFLALLSVLLSAGAAFAAGEGSSQAVAAGKEIFAEKCAMCHGAGDKLPGAKLTSPDWLSSKGVDGINQSISSGKRPMMPAFGQAQGGSLSENDVKDITKYLFSAAGILPEAGGTDAAQAPPVQAEKSDKPGDVKAEAVQKKASPPNLSLAVPAQWNRGEEALLSASLTTADVQPMKGQKIAFYLDYDFFIGLDSGSVSDSIEIGRAVTDENGVARLKYAPRLAGDLKFEARYAGGTGTNGTAQSGGVISTAAGKVEDGGNRFYRSDAGIPLPSLVHYSLVETPSLSPAAPFKHLTDLKLPALILGLLIAGIWFTYIRIAYGILGISRVYAMSHVHSTKGSFEQSRFFLPILLMVVLAIFALTLLSIIFTSPDTHLNLR